MSQKNLKKIQAKHRHETTAVKYMHKGSNREMRLKKTPTQTHSGVFITKFEENLHYVFHITLSIYLLVWEIKLKVQVFDILEQKHPAWCL